VCVLLVLSSACLWAYIIGSVCGIISNLDVAQIVYHQNMDQLNLFIQENGKRKTLSHTSFHTPLLVLLYCCLLLLEIYKFLLQQTNQTLHNLSLSFSIIYALLFLFAASDFEMGLRLNMREFFHHTAGMRRNEEYNENIISKMSPALQREVASKFCHWINQVPYLKHATSPFIVKLVHSSEFKLFTPQERIRTNDELKIVMKGTGSYRTKVSYNTIIF
jgi:hypothetical protein